MSVWVIDSPSNADCGDIPEPRRAVIEHNGVPGIWFRHELAQCILQDLAELKILRERIQLEQRRYSLLQESLDYWKAAYNRMRQEREWIFQRWEEGILNSEQPWYATFQAGFIAGVTISLGIVVTMYLITR